jgi:hypothetical protein
MTNAVANFAVNELIGMEIFNTTDKSQGTIIANTINTITVAALTGGTLNVWSLGDAYLLGVHMVDIDTGIATPYTLAAGYTLTVIAESWGYNQDGDMLGYFDTLLAVDAGIFGGGSSYENANFPGFSSDSVDPTGASSHLVDLIAVNWGINTMYGAGQFTCILEQVS